MNQGYVSNNNEIMQILTKTIGEINFYTNVNNNFTYVEEVGLYFRKNNF